MAIDLSALTAKLDGKLQTNVPFKNYTTLEIGGAAAGFIEAKTIEELIWIIKVVAGLNLPYLIIGGGSNLLVCDKPLDLIVIKNHVQGISIKNNLVTAYAGTLLQDLVNFTTDHSLGGMQRLTGIPGTLGGAIFGNAGAYGQTISDYLEEVISFDPKLAITQTLNKEECRFSYRDSAFKRTGLIILKARFRLPEDNAAQLKKESDKTLNLRLTKYKPGIKCPGSFFKNIITADLSPEILAKIPANKIVYGKIPSGYLLEAVGAQGAKRGDIEIAPFHGNLIMNLGAGKAQDFWELASEYAHKVKNQFGITLEPEVQLINLPPLV